MTLLAVKNVTKKYKELLAVNDISFDLKEGEVLGLLGPNGAGKSTTISMISTIIKPDKGSIEYRTEDIVAQPKVLQKKLGVVPQEIALYPSLTGYENLEFWGSAYGLKGDLLKSRIEEVSKIIGISQRLSDKVEVYSGGMKRRINIGAALLHKPEILIMDEPTVGIDPQSRNHILETVKSLNQTGMTIIYTSHYMEEVEFLCDRIAIMDEGSIVAKGTKAALIEQVGFQRLVKLTFQEINESVIQVFSSLEGVSKVETDGQCMVLHIESEQDIFQLIVKSADGVGAHILSYDVEKPNLEHVFLKLTGKDLRD